MDDTHIAGQLRDLLNRPDESVNLAASALLVASVWQRGLDVRAPMQELAALAGGLRGDASTLATAEEQAGALASYLGGTCGFRGNAGDYYNPSNSFLNHVLRRRTGLPITLSIIYIEVGRRLGFDVRGVGFPGHFIVGVRSDVATVYADPFNGGRLLMRTDLAEQLRLTYGRVVPLLPAMLESVSARDIIVRMLRNLKQAYMRRDEPRSALAAVELLSALGPDDLGELRDRGVLLYHLHRWDEARVALADYQRLRPNAADAAYLRRLLETAEHVHRSRN